jgi:hypothetical protein
MAPLGDPSLWLCHYTKAKTAFVDILPSGRLMMNPYSKMRDPFENKKLAFAAVTGFSDDSDRIERLFWGAQDAVSRSRDRWCLLSLTRGDDRDDRDARHQVFRCPWARPRMWEQYAEDHAGVCLVFDREQLLSVLKGALASIGQYHHGPVKYTLGGFATSAAAMVMPANAELDADPDSEATPPVAFVGFQPALRYVVVGENFPEWQLPGALAVAASAGVELRRMTWRYGKAWPSARGLQRSGPSRVPKEEARTRAPRELGSLRLEPVYRNIEFCRNAKRFGARCGRAGGTGSASTPTGSSSWGARLRLASATTCPSPFSAAAFNTACMGFANLRIRDMRTPRRRTGSRHPTRPATASSVASITCADRRGR